MTNRRSRSIRLTFRRYKIKMSFFGIFINYVCPFVGSVLGTAMFFSNTFNMHRQSALKNGLGDINPIPYSAIVGNCIGGCFYGILIKNHWLWWGNFPGLIIGLYLCCEALSACGQRESDCIARTILKRSLLLWVIFWALTVWTTTFMLAAAAQETVVGFFFSGVSVILYAAPLSTLVTVISTWDSSSLYLPMSAIAATCTGFWSVYGFVIGDPFVWVPNGLGLFLSAIQLTLIGVLPATSCAAKTRKPLATEFDPEEGGGIPTIPAVVTVAGSLGNDNNEIAIKNNGLLTPLRPAAVPLPPSYSSNDLSNDLTSHRFHHGIVPVFNEIVAPKYVASTGATLECAICLSSLAISSSPGTDLRGSLRMLRAETETAASPTASASAVELRCGHRFCAPCMEKCAANDLASCPTCRHPHELDTTVLQDRLDNFRGGYQNWRKGAAAGAKGEVDDISAAKNAMRANVECST